MSLATQSKWREICEQQIHHFEHYYETFPEFDTPASRASLTKTLARWRRRLWFAKYGRYIAALSGATVGFLLFTLLTAI